MSPQISKKCPSGRIGLDTTSNPRPAKRRATTACDNCRVRKVRCDIMQRYHITANGKVTCSNCALDEIRCVVAQSRRSKKHLDDQLVAVSVLVQEPTATPDLTGNISPASDMYSITSNNPRYSGPTSILDDIAGAGFPVPHPIYMQRQINHGDDTQCQRSSAPVETGPTYALLRSGPIAHLTPSPTLFPKHILPSYVKPLSQRMTSADIDYLFAKGVLSLPAIPVRNALLKSYIEFVHPFMPVIEVHELMEIVEEGTGVSGRISLLLFHAIMFAGTAFVDMEYLTTARFSNRKVARKAFYQKARVLYDFDYELDRIALIQSLLLMTYWYETPDDQKDAWYWMGVVISIAHIIGLNKNLENTYMEPRKKKLWRRIWWSCVMRDRLIALGMRRPTQVKDEDYNTPMLTEVDFEIAALPEHITSIPKECSLARDIRAQRTLAQMCIAKVKLCLHIGRILRTQYSVLVQHHADTSTRSNVMLFPKKLNQGNEIQKYDQELSQWITNLPATCQYSSKLGAGNSAPSIFLHRALLNMVYFATLSALHRPQVLPPLATIELDNSRNPKDVSTRKVHEASCAITCISLDLYTYDLEKYLPPSGVTVLLPAIIIHLLDIKSSVEPVRQAAIDGFCHCMLVLEKLRDNYASADFATQFLEATIRKANIDVTIRNPIEKLHQGENIIALSMAKESETHMRPEPADLTPMGYKQGSLVTDICISVSKPDSLHNTVSTSTPESGETEPLSKTGLDFASARSVSDDAYLNDLLTFDNGNEIWDFLPEESKVGAK